MKEIKKQYKEYFDINNMIEETGIDYFYVPAKITYVDKSDQIKTGTFDIKVPFSAAIDLKSSDALYQKEEFGVRQLEWDLENFAENYESTILDYFRKQYDIKRIEQYEIFPDDIYFEKETYEYLDKIKKETILERSNKMKYFTIKDIINETGIDYFLVDADVVFYDEDGEEHMASIQLEIPFTDVYSLNQKFSIKPDYRFPIEFVGARKFKKGLSDWVWDNIEIIEKRIKELPEFENIKINTTKTKFYGPYLPEKVEEYLKKLDASIVEEKYNYKKLEDKNIRTKNLTEGSNEMKYFTIKDIIEETGIDYFLIDVRIKFIDRWGVERESDTELDALLEEAVDFDEEFPATEEGIKEFRGRLSDYIHDNYDRFEDEVKDKYSGTAVEILDISIDTSPHLPREIRNYLNDLVGEIVEQKKRNIKIKSLSEARKKFFTAQDIIDNTGIDYFLVDARVEFVDRWDRRQESDTQIEVPFEDAVDLDKKFPATKRGVKEFKYRLGDYIHDNYDELEDKVRDEYYDAAEIIDISIDESPLLPGEVGDYLNDLVGEIVEQKKCICKGNIKMKSPKTIIERLLKLKELLLEANPAKGWSKVAPKTKSERESVKQRGGESCFLDPENLKFPVCRKTDAEFDCRGALAAYRRAKQYGHSSIAKKALNVAKRHGCDWAKEENKSKK